jgi:hypothetical protein
MINNFYVGFAACAVLMTLFPKVAVKVNGAVKAVIVWGIEVAKDLKAARADARASKK